MSVSPGLLIYLCIGLAAGVLSGMFGIGGGIVIVPALVLLSNFSTKTALGTSLGALLLPVGLLGAYAYWENGNLDVRASLLIAVGLTLGVAAGARLAQVLPGPLLQRLFAVFLMVLAVRLWLEARSA
jgi:uncharacterized membrane protein YfcA